MGKSPGPSSSFDPGIFLRIIILLWSIIYILFYHILNDNLSLKGRFGLYCYQVSIFDHHRPRFQMWSSLYFSPLSISYWYFCTPVIYLNTRIKFSNKLLVFTAFLRECFSNIPFFITNLTFRYSLIFLCMYWQTKYSLKIKTIIEIFL